MSCLCPDHHKAAAEYYEDLDDGSRHGRCCHGNSSVSGWAVAVYTPVLFMSALTTLPYTTIANQYLHYRLAQDLNLNASNTQARPPCDDNTTSSSVDDLLLSGETAHWAMWMSVCTDVPAMFTVCVWGAVSDLKGRHVPVLVSGVSTLLRLSLFLLTVVFSLPLYVLLAGELLNGLGGLHSSAVLMMAAAHITDKAVGERKTTEMVFADITTFLGSLVADLGTGYLLGYLSYFYVIITMCSVQVVILIYTVAFIPTSADADNPAASKEPLTARVRTIVTSTVNVYFGPKDNKVVRWQLLALLAVITLQQVVYTGCYNVFVVFLLSAPLCWTPVILGIYNACHDVGFAVAGFATSALCGSNTSQAQLQLLLGLLSGLLFCVAVGLSTVTWTVFLAMGLGSFRVLVAPSVRSMVGDLVPHSQLGAAMAGLMSSWFLCDVVGNVLFTSVYAALVRGHAHPGAVFFLAAGFYLMAIPVSGWLIWLQRKYPRASKEVIVESLVINDEDSRVT